MIKSKTVFIIGAGASSEVGLPTGLEFREQISKKIDIRFDNFGSKMVSGDYQIVEAITNFIRNKSPQSIDINPYLYAAWKIRDALPQALSIDNVLDAHAEDEKAQLCGKLGIVQAILEAERNSEIYIELDKKIDYTGIENTWYAQFLKLITENVQKKDISTIFDNVSFIIFNYDRCVEHYLVNALSNYYAISIAESQSVLKKLVVQHPYGQIGSLSYQDGAESVDFGTMKRLNLLPIAQQVKTFTEQKIEASKIEEITKLISAAETIVFLGFAFHELNMELLSLTTPMKTKIKRIFATAKGISESDCSIIVEDIRSSFNLDGQSISIDNKLTCFQLFETYWRNLSR